MFQNFSIEELALIAILLEKEEGQKFNCVEVEQKEKDDLLYIQ